VEKTMAHPTKKPDQGKQKVTPNRQSSKGSCMDTPDLPRDADMERFVLGALLLSESPEQIREMAASLPLDAFLPGTSNREIYAALCEMAGRGDSINPVTLHHELKTRGSKVELDSIAHLYDGVPRFSNSSLATEVKTLCDLATRRAILANANRWFLEAQARDADVDELVTLIQSAVANLGAIYKIGPALREVRLTDIKTEKINWLWKWRIARGELTILEGAEGEGKSTVLCAIAAAVTCGQGLEDMVFENGPENVLWLSAEDSPGHVLKPRLLAADADESRVFVVDGAFTFDDKGIALVKAMIERTRPALVVIDPIFAYTKGDPSKGTDSRATTNALRQIAVDSGAAIVLVRHIGKSKGLGDPRAAGLNSIEWRGAARSVLLCGSDPEAPQIKALTQSKNNVGPLAESIGYKLEESEPGSEVSRAFWTGPSKLTARRILAQVTDEDEQAERINAEDFLRGMLKAGETKAAEVQAAARKNSIAERTLTRAKARLRVQCRNEGYGKEKIWYWSLPEDHKGNEKTADDHQKQPSLTWPNAENGHVKASDSKESISSEQARLHGHLHGHIWGSGHVSDKFPGKSHNGNGLPLHGHSGVVGHVSEQSKAARNGKDGAGFWDSEANYLDAIDR
jgi:putative DNA primase/helicase